MFSRILATESARVPATQAGRKREPSSSARPSTASRRCSSIMPDDVAASRSPRSSKTSSWMRVELASERLDLLRRSGARAGSRSCCASGVGSSGRQSSISTRPSGALMQVRTISPSLPVDLAGAQVADPGPTHSLPDARVADALAAAEGQLERRPPRRRRGSAWTPSDSASPSLLRKTIVAALALLAAAVRAWAGSAPCAGGRSRRARSQCSVKRVEHLGGAREEGLALAPVRAQVVEVARARSGRASPVSCSCRRKPGSALAPARAAGRRR